MSQYFCYCGNPLTAETGRHRKRYCIECTSKRGIGKFIVLHDPDPLGFSNGAEFSLIQGNENIGNYTNGTEIEVIREASGKGLEAGRYIMMGNGENQKAVRLTSPKK